MEYKILAEDNRARTGIITHNGSAMETPGFLFAATYGQVNLIPAEVLSSLGVQAVIANTFHLWRNNLEQIKEKGGLRNYMQLNGQLTFTDSGGFQVMSYGDTREEGTGKIAFPNHAPPDFIGERRAFVSEEGVLFKPADSEERFLSPEKSMQLQHAIAADIVFAFDQCHTAKSYHETREALHRSHRWQDRSLAYHRQHSAQAIYGIIHGGMFEDLRKQSASYVSTMGFDGLSIGGYLGATKEEMHTILDWIIPLTDRTKPMHLLGIGRIEDIFEGVQRGVDTFDCVEITRWGRHGWAIVSPATKGNHAKLPYILSLKQSQHANDRRPLDEICKCLTCQEHTRSHLLEVRTENPRQYMRLLTTHNISIITNLFALIRRSIGKGEFKTLKMEWLNKQVV